MQAPEALIHLFAPWQELYSNSKPIETGTIFVHLAALLFGGGTAIVADRETLGVRVATGGAVRRIVDDLQATHRTVLVALSFSAVTGIAMAAADLETFFASPIFWAKLTCVLLLLVNGALLTRTEAALRGRFDAAGGQADTLPDLGLWHRLRLFARSSLILWTCTVLAGTALANLV